MLSEDGIPAKRRWLGFQNLPLHHVFDSRLEDVKGSLVRRIRPFTTLYRPSSHQDL